MLPAERAKATFNVEKMTNLLDGGEEKTKKRRFILSPSMGTEVKDKYNWERAQQLKEHLRHFLSVHEEFTGKYTPTREEVTWMSENSMMQGISQFETK